MKVFFQSPDDQNRIDGTIQQHLLAHFPEVMSAQAQADVVAVPISMFHDYRFNPKLEDVTKPVVIIDFLEYEWNAEMPDTHLLGVNTRQCRWLASDHWWRFCDWAKARKPVMYFKRELLDKDRSERVKPIEFPCYLGDQPHQSEGEFNQRPIEVFFNWGFSHPSRPQLHADIFRAMTTHGLGVISEKDQFEGYFKNPCARTWAAIFAPWYTRHPISDVQWYQMRSKMSVSLPGCGKKCFRHAEAPVSTIMALQEDTLAWSYPWIHGENAIRLRPGREFEDLDAATKRSDLYPIYLKSQETIARYRGPAYVRDYVMPLMEEAMG